MLGLGTIIDHATLEACVWVYSSTSGTPAEGIFVAVALRLILSHCNHGSESLATSKPIHCVATPAYRCFIHRSDYRTPGLSISGSLDG